MKKIILTSVLVTILSAILAKAQNVDNDTLPLLADSMMGVLPESLDANMRNVLEGWHVKHFSRPEEFCEDSNENPYFPDSIYVKRMRQMPFVVPMTYNETVRRCIDLYAERMRDRVRYMMGMADFYFPMMEEKLDAKGLPLELKYLAVVESALNPVAQSRVGACGIWQFMLSTGKIHGLEINSLIDERLDPERATDAACKYFEEMYKLYGDWLLVLAAYNCGPGNVNKAIRKSGGKTDFWRIYQHLPRETRSYVPLFMAVAYVMTYHCEHNICPVRANFSVATDTIMVERALHFDQISEILKMDKEAIRFYNPQYKREVIPGNIRPCILRLPLEETFAFLDNKDSIMAHRMDELLAHTEAVVEKNHQNRVERVIHTVKAGETVYTIANLYGVAAADLRRWNSIKGSRVKAGRKLKVNIDNGGLAYTAKNVGNSSKSNLSASNTPSRKIDGGLIRYKVKSGDTLSSIARKYGTTVKNIQQANGIRSNLIKPGQTLKIPFIR